MLFSLLCAFIITALEAQTAALEGVVFESVVDVAVHDCVDHCKRRPVCRFISYQVAAHYCLIMTDEDPSQPVLLNRTSGYVTERRGDWDESMYPGCASCSDHETCLYTNGVFTDCAITSCGPPTAPVDAEVLGNIYTCGSHLVFRCVVGEPLEDRITCLPTGNWSDTNLTCQDTTTTSTTTTSTTTTTPTTTTTTTTTTTPTTTTTTPTTTTTTPTPTTTTTTPTTTTTTAPPPPAPSCHAFDSAWRTVTLADSSVVTYKFVFDPQISHAAATTECNNQGGRLMQLFTTVKMNFVLMMTACSGMQSKDVWVDGEYDTSTTIWSTVDGDVIPMTSDFWATGKPDALDTQHCNRLIPGAGFKFDNQVCTQTFSYLCERPPPPAPSCHAFDSAWRSVTLTDGSVVTYKFVFDPQISHAAATTECNNQGGRLMQLFTTVKMNFVLMMTACSGMQSKDVWVDGEYDTSTTIWSTVDGDVIPMTPDFWATGKPDALDTQHCNRLIPGAGFKFDNQVCSQTFSYLCERP